MSEPLVQIQQLKFRYSAQGPWILDIPEFHLAAKEKVFLLGPSGSGKSTFLEILSGVLVGDQGSASVLGQDLSKMAPTGRDRFRGANLGYIFQSFNLIPYLSVRQNIELPVLFSDERRKRLKRSLSDEVEHLAGKLGLRDFLDRNATELSVGQQQRVAACRALIGFPSLILADEPTSALDQDHRQRFIELLFDVCREEGAGLLFVSHDRTLQSLFDRAVALPEINKVVAC